MDMQKNTEEIGCVYKRIKKGRGRKRFDFERKPAVKIPAANGAVLLRPSSVTASASRPPFIIIALAQGVTAQLAAEPNGRPQEPKAPRNDGSARYSPLIIGPRK